MEYCNNCLHYDPTSKVLQCKTGLFGNIYPESHGCWCWKEKENK